VWQQRRRGGGTGRAAVWCAVLLVGLLVAGCGSARPTIDSLDDEGQSGGPTKQDLQRILDHRAEAVRNKDEGAFLADLDQSNEELVQHEKMVFANLRQLQFSDFHYILPAFGGTPSPDSGGSSTYVAKVIEVAKLATDAGPGGVAPAETFRLEMASKDGRLRLTDVTAVTRENLEETQTAVGNSSLLADSPWNTTPLKIRHVANVWVAGDDSVTDLDRYAAAARTEVGRVEALWGKRLRFPGYILFLSRNKDNIRKWFSLGSDPKATDKEGVELPRQGVRGNGELFSDQYAGARIVVNLANVELNGDDPRTVMRHELTHAVTARATLVSFSDSGALQAPIWAVEGFARWVESLESPARQAGGRAAVAAGVSAGKFDGLPPGSEKFYGADIGFNYALGASVFRYIEQTKGRDAAVEFAAALFQMIAAEGEDLVRAPAFDRLCARVLGVSTSRAFFGQWASFVRRGA
jgi:hypothetical protein